MYMHMYMYVFIILSAAVVNYIPKTVHCICTLYLYRCDVFFGNEQLFNFFLSVYKHVLRTLIVSNS